MNVFNHYKIHKSALLLMGMIWFTGLAFSQTAYITVWQTNINQGSSNDDQIIIPAVGDYDYTWEEVNNPGNSGSGSGSDQMTLTFPHPGKYELKMIPTGTNPFHRIISYFWGGDARKLKKITQWGDVEWSSFKSAYEGTDGLHITAKDYPDLTKVTNMNRAFSQAKNIKVDNINAWDVSSVTHMRKLFWFSSFNDSIGNWDVSNVVDMERMFDGASKFNQPLNNWDVGKVTNMFYMFSGAFDFNQPIGSWDVSQVTNMSGMFIMASSFNQPIGNWDVSSVTNMSYMFHRENPLTVYGGLTSLPIIKKDVDYDNMAFNQPLGNWDVSRVTNMNGMFKGTNHFNQSLENWDLNNLEEASSMFSGSGLDCKNYSFTLRGWALNSNTSTAVNLDSHGMEYSPDIQVERDYLINTLGWTIKGDQQGTCILEVEKYSKESITVYPNPTRGKVRVSGLHQAGNVYLSNLKGEVLQQQNHKNETVELNLSSLADGLYFIVIISDNTKVVKKVVKSIN